MRKPVALAILSSDALSSVAYGPEAMLAVLALAGSTALGLSLKISVAIVVLMIAVGLSYRQLIRAYPHGGGSYIVAAKNLGELPALIVAGALMTEYVLTVAVSISSGVAAITSAVPGLAANAVPLGLAAIAILLVGNLRGVRQAGAIFSAPTYAFVLGSFAADRRRAGRCFLARFQRRPRLSGSIRSRVSRCCWCCGRSPRARPR